MYKDELPQTMTFVRVWDDFGQSCGALLKCVATYVELEVRHNCGKSYHILRVEAGLPSAGAELTKEFTPLEAGLDHAVSGNKGCYTGQEVLARQTTYDKVTQHLVRFQLDAPAQAGERLWAGGKPVGVIPSATVSPRSGALALGVVKRPYHEQGAELTAGEDRQRAVVI